LQNRSFTLHTPGAQAPVRLRLLAGALGIDVLVAVGKGEGPDAMAAAARGASMSVYAVPDGDAAVDLLRESLRPADAVLVKASSMVGLSAVAAALDSPA
jgi:UDP-N-acetylmuramoyl-tripeptide--D-alanyl-D-alanine ligase